MKLHFFDDLHESGAISIGPPTYINASGGVKPAYYSVPDNQPEG
jgi:hypothetical protein